MTTIMKSWTLTLGLLLALPVAASAQANPVDCVASSSVLEARLSRRHGGPDRAAVEQLCGDTALTALRRLAQPHPGRLIVRLRAINLLGAWDAAPARQLLSELALDRSGRGAVRRNALQALRQHTDEATARRVGTAALRDPDIYVRVEAARLLQGVPGSSATLEEARRREEDTWVRSQLTELLNAPD